MPETLMSTVLEYMTTFADKPMHYTKVATEIAVLHPEIEYTFDGTNQCLVRLHNKHIGVERVAGGTYVFRSLSKEGTQSVYSIIHAAAQESEKKKQEEKKVEKPEKPALAVVPPTVAVQPLPTGFRANMVFKGVGIDSSGSAIVKDPDGRLYKLVVL